MGNLTKLADVLPKFQTLTEMNDHFRKLQQQERPEEVLRMKSDIRSKLQEQEDEDDAERPPFIPDGIEKSLIGRKATIRPGILPCITEPAGQSFCDGSAHMKIYWSRLYRRWDWHCFQLCPVSVAESRINAPVKEKAEEGDGWPKKKQRK